MKRLLAAVLLPALAGCAAVAGAAVGAALAIGAYSYVNNKLSRDYGAPMDRVYEASFAAADAMDIEVRKRSRGVAESSISGRMPGGESVSIDLKRQTEDETKVTVSVGTFESDAHRAAAEAVHDEILRRLKAQSPAAMQTR